MKNIFIMIFSIMLLSFPVKALEVTYKDNNVFFVGAIQPSSSDLFTAIFNEVLLNSDVNKPINIYIDSEGGEYYAARTIVNVIKTAIKYGTPVHTYVTSGSHCYSSCPLVFVSGEERFVGENSMFGFHGVMIKGVSKEEIDKNEILKFSLLKEINDIRENYYNIIGEVSPRFENFLREYRVLEGKSSDDKNVDNSENFGMIENKEIGFRGETLFENFPGFATTIVRNNQNDEQKN